jgi:hypothetical protein
MSKYQRNVRPLEPSFGNRKIHPIWRGVGFAFMILIPFMSYITTDWFLTENVRRHWIEFPANLLIDVKGLPEDLVIRIIVTVALMVILYALLTFFSLLIFSVFAPPRYGPLDVPPVKYSGRPYKR